MTSAIIGECIPVAPLQAISRNLFNGAIIPFVQCGLPPPVVFSTEVLIYSLDTYEVIIAGGLFEGTRQTGFILELVFPLVGVLEPATGCFFPPG